MAYKYVNPEGLEHLIDSIKNKFVQKVTGKDLSTNDFTNSLKNKLDGIEAGAQVNSVEMSDLTAHTTATGNVHDMPSNLPFNELVKSLVDKSLPVTF